jgi:hypothetical protein
MSVTPLPNLAAWPEYRQSLAKRDALAADLRDAQNEATRLRRESPAARLADDQAAAQALADGTKPPARKAEQANKAAVEQAEAAVRALEIAVRGADERVRSLLSGEREQAREAAQATLEQAQTVYEQAVQDVAAARQAYFAARRAADWLNDPARLPWKDRPAPPLRISGVTRANGDPLTLEPVLAALQQEAEGQQVRATSPVFTPGADQRASGVTPRVRKVIHSEISPREGHVVMVDREDADDYATKKAAREAASLARDRAENEAAARAYAEQYGLPDPLADLRE